MALDRGPLVEGRDGLHGQVPALRAQPTVERARQSVLGVKGEGVPELLSVGEGIDRVRRQELRPRLERLGIGPPRARARGTADGELPQPSVHGRRRSGDTVILKAEIVVNEDGHPRPDQWLALHIPFLPAGGGEVVQDHRWTLW